MRSDFSANGEDDVDENAIEKMRGDRKSLATEDKKNFEKNPQLSLNNMRRLD